MAWNISDFLNILFDEHQKTCFAPSVFETKLKWCPDENDIFFSINALQVSRKDGNVTCFANFLIELDDMELNKQFDYVTSKVPISTAVYSGGKSMHFIVALETPLSDKQEYTDVFRRLQKLLPEIDPACKNPSRFSRLPFRVRPNNGKKQELIYLGSRVNTKKFLDLLPKIEYNIKQEKSESNGEFIKSYLLSFCIEPDKAIESLNLAGRNAFFYYLYERFKELGLSKEKQVYFINMAYNNLKDTSDFPIEEAYLASRIRKG